MRIKEYKVIIRDVFLLLLVTTILFSIYRYFNPYDFPGLQTKLIIVTTLFGILYFIKIIDREKIRITKLKIILLLLIMAPYFIFLIWVYVNLAFDDYVFFILLSYIPISLFLNLNSKIPIILGLILLAFCPIYIIQDLTKHANQIALFAYYFLFIGVILQLTELLTISK